MKIFDSFKGFELTQEQQELLKKLNEFLEDTNDCFIIKGYAGTGKTFLMRGITDYLNSIKRNFVLAAPTGRAAKVMSQRTSKSAYTIHKTIYSSHEIQNYEIHNKDRTETFKFFYKLKKNEDNDRTVYIIDEASLISDVYTESEFFRFGSGYLLKDLLDYTLLKCVGRNNKIIFVGDTAQLPPVNMNFSPALDEQYLHEKYKIRVFSFQLTQVVRHQKDSGILYNATFIRNSLGNDCFNQLDIKTHFDDIRPIQPNEFLNVYLQACGNQIDEDTIIIAYSNSVVKQYNDFVRNYFFPNQKNITCGDRVILLNNSLGYEIELNNGDFATVIEVSENPETFHIPLKRKNPKGEIEEVDIPLNFRQVTLRFKNSNHSVHDIDCKILENVLYSHNRDLSSDEMKALYVFFILRHKNLKPGSEDFIKALQNDKYYNALRVKFGYAVTCHKSQGSEWKKVFVDFRTSMGYLNSSYFRWIYTAITRAKETLYTLKEPHFHLASNLKPLPLENFKPVNDLIILKSEMVDMDTPFIFPTETPFLSLIFWAIFDLMKDDGINIESIKHYPWSEHYIFSKETTKATIKVDYNKKNKISGIQKITDNELSHFILQKLQILVDKFIILDQPINIEPKKFEFHEPFLKEFYDFIVLKVSNHEIFVEDIKQSQWLQKYTFKKGNLTAEIDFYYNSKKQFHKFVPQPQKSTSTDLLNAIMELIKN